MTADQSSTRENGHLGGWKLGARGLFRIFLVVAVLAGVLFASAGRIDWLAAWLLILLYSIFLLILMIWGARNAPDLLQERGAIASNVKTWDKLINAIYAILLIVLFIIAGLDAGRYGWSEMPLALQVLGTLGLVLDLDFINLSTFSWWP